MFGRRGSDKTPSKKKPEDLKKEKPVLKEQVEEKEPQEIPVDEDDVPPPIGASLAGLKEKKKKDDKKAGKEDPQPNEIASVMEAVRADKEPPPAPESRLESINKDRMQNARRRIWADLRDGIDLKSLARMEEEDARSEIYSAVEEIGRFRNLGLKPAELKQIAKEAADDMLGFGPLEALLVRDDIADIMINDAKTTYIEVNGKIEKADIEFNDDHHLLTVCQRIVGAIGRRVDESSPICDARLADGSRVNVIIPPLAVDGPSMTIRKFTKEKLTLEKLVDFGSLTPASAEILKIIGHVRCNVLISGGTGSGKTTMLNCLTRYISHGERIVTCEDACELQLQQPHTVRLETRPPNLEGKGEVTMRDLVKNCLRMRPDRIIVGEVRGPEAFDLLQAMNTGHDGSMGTVHANNPREAISRMENMIAMGGLNLPARAVREQIASAINLVIQVQRLRDGSRKLTHITEITGMEGDVVTMQDLCHFEYQDETDDGKIVGTQKFTGLRPKFHERARMYGLGDKVLELMGEAFNE